MIILDTNVLSEMMAPRRPRPISHFDAQIAAIALTVGAALATRNLADFQDLGLRLVDPWGP